MQTPSPKFLQKRWTFFLASVVAKHQGYLGDRKDVAMGKPTWTIRLAIILLSASGAMSTLSQRIMAQTTETQCASDVPGSQPCGYADTGSVAISSGSKGESQDGSTASAGSNQNEIGRASCRERE